MYDFQKYKAMRFLVLAVSNGTTAIKNVCNDQVYLKNRLKKQNKKNSLCFSKVTEPLKGRQWVINAFNFQKKTVNVVDDHYYHYACNDCSRKGNHRGLQFYQ